MSRAKPKPTYEVMDRFRAKLDYPYLPYSDREIVVVGVLNLQRSRYLMAADGEHFEAHGDWLYSYWEKIGE